MALVRLTESERPIDIARVALTARLISGDTFQVPSLTERGVIYTVNIAEGICTCAYSGHKGTGCIHYQGCCLLTRLEHQKYERRT